MSAKQGRHLSMSSKRSAFSLGLNHNRSSKRRKIDQNAEFVSKIRNLSQDAKMNDVIFTVGINGNTKDIRGVKFLFCAHSEVFKKMFCIDMIESNDGNVIIKDVSIEAFKYIKAYTHGEDPKLQYQHIVDILYAAQKYMIQDIVKKCKDKLSNIDNLNIFYDIMFKIGKYAPSTFGSLDTIISSEYVSDHIDDIVYHRKFKLLKIFQVVWIVQFIENDFERYRKIKTYCISIVDNRENCHDKELIDWNQYFIKYFIDTIDFNQLSFDQLINEVSIDQVMDNDKLLAIIGAKGEEIEKENKELRQEIKKLRESCLGQPNITQIQFEDTIDLTL